MSNSFRSPLSKLPSSRFITLIPISSLKKFTKPEFESGTIFNADIQASTTLSHISWILHLTRQTFSVKGYWKQLYHIFQESYINQEQNQVQRDKHWQLFYPFLVSSHQTLILMKKSFIFVSRRRLQDVLIKTNVFALVRRLQKTSSRDLQDNLIKINIFVLVKRL